MKVKGNAECDSALGFAFETDTLLKLLDPGKVTVGVEQKGGGKEEEMSVGVVEVEMRRR